MKRYILQLLAGIMLFTLAACSDDDLGPSIFDTSERDRTEVDLWLLENFVKPYNIEIVYKWEDSQTGLGYNLTPPEEGKAWELARALKTMWVEPYVEEGGRRSSTGYLPSKWCSSVRPVTTTTVRSRKGPLIASTRSFFTP